MYMVRIGRILLLTAVCLSMFFGTLSVASAATSVPASTTSSYWPYWSKYNLPGASASTQPTTPAATPTTPTTPATPQQPAQPAQDSSQQAGLSQDEKLMFDLVNQERIKAGLPAFTIDMRLVNLARMKSQDMYQNNYFSHTSPTYGSALDMERKAGISARVMGAENIAKAATTQRAHELFMGSAGHRANILNAQHTAIGIGIVKTTGGVIVTQLFIGN